MVLFLSMNDQKYMKIALNEAKKAFDENEVPIGAVLVSKEGKILAKAHNKKERNKDISMHAEILTLRKASKKMNSYYFDGAAIYINLEPCLMCLDAIISSHIKRIVVATKDDSIKQYIIDFKKDFIFNNNVEIIYGILEKESKELIKKFFKDKRS